jgi:hypothetical protein
MITTDITALRDFALDHPNKPYLREAADEIELLHAVIIRAKDALLDGQSTQYVRDMLIAAVLGPKPR